MDSGRRVPRRLRLRDRSRREPDWPSNNTYGGCSPGLKSTPADPGAPCPSYDPGSWANDTLSPWKIAVPQFFNSARSVKAAQVAFTQDFGGIDLESQIGGTGCQNAAGSAWCSYPWYSFSCAAQAFEFGAVDYATFSADFGKYNEYAQQLQANALGFGFYPPTNFSIPTCTNPSFSVTVGASGPSAGSAYFLSHSYATATTVTGVGPGTYSLNAINSGTGKFDHWVTTGAVAVTSKTSAWTSVAVTGAGTISAVFSNTARSTKVTFLDLPSGTIGLNPSMLYNGPLTGSGNPIGTFANAASHTLTPGIYSIVAYPAADSVFGHWSATGGAVLASNATPYTWLIVTGASSGASVTAHFASAGATTEALQVEVVGNGSVTVVGHTVTGATSSTGNGTFHPSPGTYPITATPGTGANTVQWQYGPAGVMINFSLATRLTIEAGTTFVEAIFGEQAAVTLSDSPSTGGAITVAPAFGPASPSGSGTTKTLGPGTYGLLADPFAGMVFSGWSVTGGASVASASALATTLTVASAATVTATYKVASSVVGVKFVPSPTGDGGLQLDGMSTFSVSTTNSSVGVGLHTVTAVPAPGFLFSKWTAGSKVLLVGTTTSTHQVINVTGGGSSITAVFVPGTFPFTFVAVQGAGSNITVRVNGIVISSGETIQLPTGHYSAPFAGGGLGFNGGWTTTSNITFTNKTPTSATFNVFGSGTLYLVLVGSTNVTGGPNQAGASPVATVLPTSAGGLVWSRVRPE